jgi:hypothetical protein
MSIDARENIGLPALKFIPYNSTSKSSVILSPTTLSANVVAEMFPISSSGGSAPDGSGRWCSYSETPMICCDSPLARYCTGHCRTNGAYLQQSQPSDNADVVCFFSFYLYVGIMSRVRSVSHLLKIANGLGKLHKDPP